MNEEITKDEKLKLLNDKKVEAYNIIRQLTNANQAIKNLNDSYGKLSQEIVKLEQEYIEENKLDKK